MRFNFRITLWGIILALCISGFAITLNAQAKKKFTVRDLPAAVKSAFDKTYPNAKIKGVDKEEENGKTLYEIESVDAKLKRDLLYTPEGEAYEIEETIAASELPPSVKDALQKQFKTYTVKKGGKDNARDGDPVRCFAQEWKENI